MPAMVSAMPWQLQLLWSQQLQHTKHSPASAMFTVQKTNGANGSKWLIFSYDIGGIRSLLKISY
jgi:hypothetical protein